MHHRVSRFAFAVAVLCQALAPNGSGAAIEGFAQADLAITKTDGVSVVTAGGSTTYTITASNAGPSNAPGATIADTFPAVLTCTWTCVGAGGGTCTAGPTAGHINDSANLPAGGSVTYTASCTLVASATGTLSNTATVAAPGAVADPDPANNSATDTDTITRQADLAITKTDGVTTAIPGGSVTYTVTASNAGPSNAPAATVADTFPAGLTCSWTCVGAGGASCTAGPTAGNLSDSVNLPVGGSVTYTASCTIAANATGTLSNTATVATPAGVTDPSPGNNSATDTDTLSPSADVSITKTDGVTSATPGGSVTYAITASNAGPSNAPAATVADTFPAGLTCSWTCVGAGGATCTAGPTAGNLSDSVNMPAGGSVTYTANCTIAANATGSLSNTATVATPVGTSDLNPANNSATDTDTLSSPATITGTKSVSGSFQEGGTVTYAVVLSNGSSTSQLDNPGDEFTDVLPPSLVLVSASASSGAAVATVATNTVTWNGSIPGNAAVTITIVATVATGTSGTTLSNQGAFVFDADGNGSNESSGVTDDPSAPGAADPTGFIVGGVLAIPTLDVVGLVALAGGLALAARRRLRH